MKKHLQPLTPAALYARVSSERQDVDLSVSAQLRALKDYAKAVRVLRLPRPRLDAVPHVTPAALAIGGEGRAPYALRCGSWARSCG